MLVDFIKYLSNFKLILHFPLPSLISEEVFSVSHTVFLVLIIMDLPCKVGLLVLLTGAHCSLKKAFLYLIIMEPIMYNASVSSINKKVLTVRPKWHYYVPYLINFSNRLKRNNCSFKCYHIVASLKELVVPLHMDQFGSFKRFLFMKQSSSQFDNK